MKFYSKNLFARSLWRDTSFFLDHSGVIRLKSAKTKKNYFDSIVNINLPNKNPGKISKIFTEKKIYQTFKQDPRNKSEKFQEVIFTMNFPIKTTKKLFKTLSTTIIQ